MRVPKSQPGPSLKFLSLSLFRSLTHSIPRLYLHASLPLFRAGGQVLSDRHSLGPLSLSLSLSLSLALLFSTTSYYTKAQVLSEQPSNAGQSQCKREREREREREERGGGEREKSHTQLAKLRRCDCTYYGWWWGCCLMMAIINLSTCKAGMALIMSWEKAREPK